MPTLATNGQLAAAVAALVDAVFGILYVTGVIHSQPDQTTVLAVVGVTVNLALYVLAYIQHQQHSAAVVAAAAPPPSVPASNVIVPPVSATPQVGA